MAQAQKGHVFIVIKRLLRLVRWLTNNVIRFQLALVPFELAFIAFVSPLDIRELTWEVWWQGYLDLSFFLGMGYVYYLVILFWIPQEWSQLRHRVVAIVTGPVATFFTIGFFGYPMLAFGILCGLCAKLPAPRLGILVGGQPHRHRRRSSGQSESTQLSR
jgi:hypothetical protein